ncbi:diguanylate cyclase, partial [Sphingomonas sp.]|uniref:diguanylate cyclase domain-containing protein n=1 Tax=Sphingomonas sp. TaxID=28214 RepID=UPI0025ECDBE1
MVDRVRLLEADRREQLAAAYQQATILAREASQAQQDIATGAHAVLQIVARTLASVESRQACPEIFGQAPIGVSWLRGLSLLDRNGRIVCSTFVGATGLDFSDRPYFQEALRTGGFALSDYLLGRHQPGPTILAALALKDARGGVTGIVSASIDMQWIGRLAGVIDERPGAVVLVVDRAGTLISSHPAGLGEPGRRLGDPQLVEAMLGHAAGTVASAGVDGVRRIFAFQRLEATDARLAVGLNEAEVLWRIDRETTIGYVQLAIVCAAVLVGVWMGGERLIIQPIRSLTRSAIRIGLGNLQTRLSATSWAAEFAPLAAALDSMAHKLGAREDELRFANTHLAELASIDGLSGLANRRAFDAALATDWQQAIEQRHPLGLLMIDVDHFKLFNDTHGHVEGDECLRAVGEVIAQIAFERSCTPARYGGEEFAI